MTTTDSLEIDSDFSSPLERVNFEAGMLLGVEATRDEQDFHRRRLNRHEYWFQGSGTLLGLGVSLQAEETEHSDSDMKVDLLVSPGVGIDGLGREVMSHEPYCLNLREWFASQLATTEGNLLLQDGLDMANDALSLLITMRYQSCDTGLQPVLARKVNAGTDPVQVSRARNSLCLEIIPGPVPEYNPAWPWRAHTRLADAGDRLTDAEEAYIAAQPEAERALLRAHGERVYSLPNNNRALEASGDPVDIARTLLAHVRVPLRSASLPVLSPIINRNRITVNNLVRPFIQPPGLVANLDISGGLTGDEDLIS